MLGEPLILATEAHPRESTSSVKLAEKETAPARAGAVGPGLLTPGELHQRYYAHAPTVVR